MAGWGRTTLGAARLRAAVLAAYAVDLVALDAVAAGADPGARTWRGRDGDGRSWAVRETTGDPRAGLEAAAGLGAPGVPAPTRTVDGALWTGVDGAHLSLVPWVDGPTALAVDPSPDQWRAFGHVLARVHAADPPAGLPRDDHSGDEVAGYVDAADRAAAAAVDDLGREAAAEWAAVRPRVVAVLDLVRRYGAVGADDAVLCHGDPHRDNLLLDPDGRSVWLIDWDDAMLSWRERDLLMVVDGLPGFSTVSAEQRAWFEEGYGPLHLDLRRLAHHRGVRAVEDVALFVVDALDVDRPVDQRRDALDLVRAQTGDQALLALTERTVGSAG